MDSKVFRQESVDNISTPQQMNEYLKVSSPSVWILLAGILVLLLGALAWGVWGRMETVQPVAIVAEDGVNYAYIRTEKADQLAVGSVVRVDSTQYRITEIQDVPVLAETLVPMLVISGSLGRDTYVTIMKLDGEPVSDIVTGEAVLESFAPISLLLN